MPRDVPERLKKFKAVALALERFCERTLAEIAKLSATPGKSSHERYLDVYRRLDDRDKELARAFNDMRRSTMITQLAQMRVLGIVNDDELAQFSGGTREVIALIAQPARRP
jgi:hypothetical protein